MGGNCRASFFSLYLAPTHSIAVGQSDSVGYGSADYGSKSGSDSVRGDNGVLWYQGSETRLQATAQKASEEEGGIWDSILEWFGNQFDSFLDSITKLFTKEFWDLKTSISDSLTNATNGFWNKLTGSLDTQKGVLIKIQTEMELQTKKLNDFLYFFTNKNNDDGLLWHLIRTSTGVQELRNTFLGSNNEGFVFWWIKKLGMNSDQNLKYLKSLTNTFTMSNDSNYVFWWVKKQVVLIEGGVNYLEALSNTFTKATNNNYIFWWIQKMGVNSDNVLENWKKLETNLTTFTHSTNDGYIFWWIKKLGGNSDDILKAVKAFKPSSGGFTLDELERTLNRVLDGLKDGEKGEGWFSKLIREAVKQGIKTFGDIIETGIKTLGEVGKELIKSVADVVKALADLVGDIMKELLKLIVPENSDFITEGFDNVGSKFNKKFEVVLDLSGQFTTLFKPIHSDVFEILSFEFMGQKADANQAKQFIDPWASKIRDLLKIFIWVAMVIWIHRKVTGRGDLINDN